MVYSKTQEEDFAFIKETLKKNPQGLTVTELAKILGRTKNTVGRYLDILHASGQVEIRACGTAKIFSLSRRVPFASILQHTRDLMIMLDADMRILDINDPFLSLLHITRKEAIGSNIEFLPVADPSVQELLAKIAAAIREKRMLEDLDITKETERYFKARILETQFEDGSTGFTVILIDLTEQKQAERALRQSEEKYRDLVEHASTVILMMDLSGNITLFNEYAEHFFGFSREEIMGKNVVGTIVPATESSGRDLQELIAGICTNPERYKLHENENITRDGKRVWLRWTNRMIRDGSGRPTRILSIGVDITELKQMEEQLRASEKRFRDMANLAPQPAFEADRSGTLLFANEAAYQTFGYSPEELPLGINVYTMLVPEDRERARQNIARMLQDGMQLSSEYTAQRKDGSRFPIIDYAAPIYEGDRIAGFRGIVIDLTRQKEAEAALRRERDFIDAVLHALNALVLVLDREGRIVRFNHACEAVTAYSEAEVKGRAIWDIFLLPEEVAGVKKVFATLVAGSDTLVEHSNCWLTRSGDKRFIQWSNTILRDEEGAVTYVIGTGIDITGQRRLEKKLDEC
ncbi:MAG: PAS domain S-box protein [Methanomicrobiaceae archaeon]|uniref:Sensor histidine kinase n=1 Tax=hydrocarbon metagenome TaxID=938273 RepID=A0A0W8FFC3_9ZZZZ|nr:PAS domain S-box protein [Methanomicrobiaceae archaeon]MDD5419386.1 PAS domain S-box protein [Methanomicrobiaceae archaeon]